MKLSFLDKIVFRAPLNSYDKRDAVDLNAMEEALYLASPVLLAEARKGNSKRLGKLQDSIYKYHLRSCTRCTPFGLFAGVGTAEWGTHSSIILSGRQRRTRLDMNYVCALGKYVASLDEVKEKLLFFPNNSIYVVGDKVRYVETQRLYSLSEVRHSEYLDKVLRIAQDGAYAEDLATAITDAEISIEEAKEFISELIDSQLLKSELEPNVTGTYYFDKILQKINLQHINESIQNLDNNIYNSIDDYKNIISQLKELPVPFEENQLFQTDLYWNTSSATLDKKIQDELLKALNFVSRLSPQGESQLKKFAKEFYERYEHAEVPLLQALDTEAGIGYAHNKGKDNNPLIDGILTEQKTPTNNVLHKKIIGQYTVAFTDEDLPAGGPISLPATMAVGFTLPDDGQIMLGYASGPCAANILGRFCHPGNEILKITEEIIQHENNFYKDKIVAEIVHLPEARTGNILFRPAFREYEIPYLCNASTAPEKTIALSDLYISVSGDRIILKSKKLNKEIIPRLTNAHNFSFNSLPVYHFLCDLQAQGARPAIAFDWGVDYKFMPRAVYGNVILKPATWKLDKEDVQELLHPGFNVNAIAQFLIKWQMPPEVLLTEEDNTLLLDWYNETSVNSFAAAIKQKEKFILTEHLFKKSVIKDAEGRCHVNEFLAFVINHEFPQADRKPAKFKHEQRTFLPGSEWLYYKIYTGPKTADAILRNHIKPFVDDLMTQGLIDKWFFIRYLDPHHHLRLRLHLRCDAGKIINQFNIPGWKIQIDTYQREIERYGLFGIENCESYFHHDSEYILSILNNIQDEEDRWLAGFKAVDETLNNFGHTLESKEKLINQLAQSFTKEFGGGKILKLSLSNKYRKIKQMIEDNLAKNLTNTPPLIQNFQLIRDNGFYLEYDDLVCSFIHMTLNRLFRSQQRMHELVIYDLLSQYYRSLRCKLLTARPLQGSQLP